ncbi:MAG: TlpA family protein disulfide reductase, partial [bacterium]
PNCRRNIPHEVRLYEQYGDQIEVIGVNLQENPNLVRSFADRYGINFPVVLDPRGIATNLYRAQYTNFKVLINKEGQFVRFVPGDIREADFQSLITT